MTPERILPHLAKPHILQDASILSVKAFLKCSLLRETVHPKRYENRQQKSYHINVLMRTGKDTQGRIQSEKFAGSAETTTSIAGVVEGIKEPFLPSRENALITREHLTTLLSSARNFERSHLTSSAIYPLK